VQNMDYDLVFPFVVRVAWIPWVVRWLEPVLLAAHEGKHDDTAVYCIVS